MHCVSLCSVVRTCGLCRLLGRRHEGAAQTVDDGATAMSTAMSTTMSTTMSTARPGAKLAHQSTQRVRDVIGRRGGLCRLPAALRMLAVEVHELGGAHAEEEGQHAEDSEGGPLAADATLDRRSCPVVEQSGGGAC